MESFGKCPDSHIRGHGCPTCAKLVSTPELEICNMIKPIEFIKGERNVLEGKEIDVYVPSLNIGIEYHGLIWHSEKFGKDKNYHLWKLNKCNEKGVELIQIFEDEWLKHKDVCKFHIENALKINNKRIISEMDCKCNYVDDKKLINGFLESNTIEGKVGFSKCVGAFYNGKLIACITLKKNKDTFLINRIAFDINYNYESVGNKMIFFLISNSTCNKIVLFADRRWCLNVCDNSYTKIGFEIESYTKPQKWYVCDGRSRSLRDKNMKNNGIYDCGKIKYVYYLEKEHKRSTI